jgi:hypothetical protein
LEVAADGAERLGVERVAERSGDLVDQVPIQVGVTLGVSGPGEFGRS